MKKGYVITESQVEVRKYKLLLITVIVVGCLVAATLYLMHANIPILEPAGQVGQRERTLIFIALGLSLIVVIPVYVLLLSFAWKYRESNKKAKYSPELDHNRLAEAIWWLIPTILITILSVITWDSSHALDPYRPISSNVKPLNIQVVALDWKWLFIYPSQKVASVNLMQFPINTPLNLQITSDAPMNSFWVPQLGGQIYAMPGMVTQLHLIANKSGNYNGFSANISGEGFASMMFTAKASNSNDFNSWISSAKKSNKILDQASYNQLAKPSSYYPISYYSSVSSNLFISIVTKYMSPNHQSNSNSYQYNQPGMGMNM